MQPDDLQRPHLPGFEGAIAAGGSVRAINVKGGASFTRREIDSLGEVAKQYGAKGLAWRKKANGEVTSSYAKFLSDAENAAIDKRMDFSEGDLIVIVADNNKIVFDAGRTASVCRTLGSSASGRF